MQRRGCRADNGIMLTLFVTLGMVALAGYVGSCALTGTVTVDHRDTGDAESS